MPLPRPNIFNINWWLVGPHYIVLNGAISISLNVRVVLLAITLHIVKATKLLQKKCNIIILLLEFFQTLHKGCKKNIQVEAVFS